MNPMNGKTYRVCLDDFVDSWHAGAHAALEAAGRLQGDLVARGVQYEHLYVDHAEFVDGDLIDSDILENF